MARAVDARLQVGAWAALRCREKMLGLLRKSSIENDWFVQRPFFSIVVQSFDAQGNMLSFRCSMGMTEIRERIFDRKIG